MPFSGNSVRVANAGDRSQAQAGEAAEAAPASQAGRAAVPLAELATRGAQTARRLPMLDAALARLPDLIAARLQSTWRLHARVVAGTRRAEPEKTCFEAPAGPMLVAAFDEAGAEVPGAIALGGEAVYLLVDALLGGPAGAPSGPGRDRFSHLERCLMRPFADQALDALREAFAPSADLSLAFRAWLDAPGAIATGDEEALMHILPLEIALGERKAALTLYLPQRFLEPHVERLSAPYPGERLGRDAVWFAHLAEEVRRAKADCEVVLFEGALPVSALGGLQPGRTIAFGLPADSGAELHSGGVRLARGRLGRSGQRIALRLEGTAAAIRKEGQ